MLPEQFRELRKSIQEMPISLPATDSSTVSLKDERNSYSIFKVWRSESRREINLCYKWNWNLGPFNFQSGQQLKIITSKAALCNMTRLLGLYTRLYW